MAARQNQTIDEQHTQRKWSAITLKVATASTIINTFALIAVVIAATYTAPSSNLPQAPIINNLPEGVPIANPAYKIRKPVEITVRRRDIQTFNSILHEDILRHHGALIDDAKAPYSRTYAVHADYIERIHLLTADAKTKKLTPDYAQWARQTALTADITTTGTPDTEVTFETKAPLITRRPVLIAIMTISSLLTVSIYSATVAICTRRHRPHTSLRTNLKPRSDKILTTRPRKPCEPIHYN